MLPLEDRYTPPVHCTEIREASTNKRERGAVEDVLVCLGGCFTPGMFFIVWKRGDVKLCSGLATLSQLLLKWQHAHKPVTMTRHIHSRTHTDCFLICVSSGLRQHLQPLDKHNSLLSSFIPSANWTPESVCVCFRTGYQPHTHTHTVTHTVISQLEGAAAKSSKMLIQGKITNQLPVDSPSNLAALV